MTPRLHSIGRQSGSVMVIGLTLLLLVGALSFAMLQTVGLEERLAYHERDRQVAFHAAEAALRHAQSLIENNHGSLFSPLSETNFPSPCANGLCRSSPASPAWRTLTASAWLPGSALTREYPPPTDAVDLRGLGSAPRYFIEYQGNVAPIEPGAPCVAMFLITARSTGLSPHSIVTLQSEYRLRAGSCQRAI